MDSVFLYFITKHPLTDAEALGGLRLNPLMLVEGVKNGIPLNLLQKLGETLFFFGRLPVPFRFFLSEMKRKVLACDNLSAAKHHCPFNKVLQLPDISGIGVAEKEGSCLF